MQRAVQDLMQPAVKVVMEEESLADLDQAFLDAKVGGFPVVDQDGQLVGIVSHADVVRQLTVERGMAEYVSDYYRDVQHYESEPGESLAGIAERIGRRLEDLQIKDVMSTKVIVVSPSDSLTELAYTFVHHHIHRLPVVEKGRLVGIVTTMDVVRLLANEGLPT